MTASLYFALTHSPNNIINQSLKIVFTLEKLKLSFLPRSGLDTRSGLDPPLLGVKEPLFRPGGL